jgi:hypothetical protein
MSTYTLYEEVFGWLKLHGPQVTTELVQKFTKRGFTKQGVYKVLRKLRDEEKIIWYKSHIEINLVWLYREIDALTALLPTPQIALDDFSKKHVYRVANLAELDVLYDQLFVKLMDRVPSTIQNFFFYDLHNYAYVYKASLVDWYVDFMCKRKANIFLLVGSQSSLDYAITCDMSNVRSHCIPKKWNAFVTVFGNYVIHNSIDAGVAKELDMIFKNETKESGRSKLIALAKVKGNFKITVEMNLQKARQIEKVFKKYFLIK